MILRSDSWSADFSVIQIISSFFSSKIFFSPFHSGDESCLFYDLVCPHFAFERNIQISREKKRVACGWSWFRLRIEKTIWRATQNRVFVVVQIEFGCFFFIFLDCCVYSIIIAFGTVKYSMNEDGGWSVSSLTRGYILYSLYTCFKRRKIRISLYMHNVWCFRLYETRKVQ